MWASALLAAGPGWHEGQLPQSALPAGPIAELRQPIVDAVLSSVAWHDRLVGPILAACGQVRMSKQALRAVNVAANRTHGPWCKASVRSQKTAIFW